MLHIVAVVVAIAEDTATRTHRKRKREAVLAMIGAWMHPCFHDALAHGMLVAKAGKMADRIEIHACSEGMRWFRKINSRSLSRLNSQRGLNRVLHVIAVEQLMDQLALLSNGVQKLARIAFENFVDRCVAQHRMQPARSRM